MSALASGRLVEADWNSEVEFWVGVGKGIDTNVRAQMLEHSEGQVN